MLDETTDPCSRRVQHAIELLAGVGRSFGRALHLDESPRPRHDDVAVDVCCDIFRVGEIQPYLVAEQAHGNGSHVIRDRRRGHLACGDEPDHPLNRQQRDTFAAALARLPAAPASLAASSGIFLGPDYHFDLVRPGVCLYGVNPQPGHPNPMAPVLQLQAKILQIRDVDTPQTVGYGATHRFAGPTRVATVAAGYADGYPRSLSGRGTAHFRDISVPVVGRVSMDLITLDVTRAPEARPGEMVDLIGPHHDVDALAAEAGTIGYEILTSLGRRYLRHYVNGGGGA